MKQKQNSYTTNGGGGLAKLKFKGLEEYEGKLLKLESISKECIGRAIYEGAGEIANAVKANIEALPIDTRHVRNGELLNGITETQKQGLRDGFGIAPMQNDNGYMHVKLGFDGYNGQKTRKYPNGQPNAVIARSVNSGSSFRQRIPFVDNAVNAHKAAAEQKMKDEFDKALKERF